MNRHLLNSMYDRFWSILPIGVLAIAIARVSVSVPQGPGCSFHYATGLWCPGCGGTRALHAMCHGQWSEAWGYNPAAFIIVPGLIAMSIWVACQTPVRSLPVLPVKTIMVAAMMLIAFGVARNIPDLVPILSERLGPTEWMTR
ncbi:DUF2752 domain-containing protein [Actinomyces vulturis]|uniref:DUF2752 domain-containing protein n=1 Tax=Actinomyces vulturis TaxID=1857645 RepID=UPI00083430C5|nr:DUF2752 domain-containing protein [Actinomyces vulturis]